MYQNPHCYIYLFNICNTMKKYILFYQLVLIAFLSCGNSDDTQVATDASSCSPTTIQIGCDGGTQSISVKCTREWSIYSDESWITVTPTSSMEKEGVVTATIAANSNTTERKGTIVVKAGTSRSTIDVTQEAKPKAPVDTSIDTPEGYELVWNDEFAEGDSPSTEWSYETGGGGWGNNELQHYVSGSKDGEQLAMVKDGIFSIIAKKIDGTVYSIRINTRKSWKYGYFEARLKLPTGKGTWPAFWMMPANFTAWPADGEIDIMEEVGYNANYVSSSIHCTSYNHQKGTQKTKETYLPTAQSEYHVYALEWTEDYIRTLVDGKELFYFANDKTGNKDTWPFNAPFYLKLNLAWGGDWGGAQGVDESVLPAVYEIDYVRVFQKTK